MSASRIINTDRTIGIPVIAIQPIVCKSAAIPRIRRRLRLQADHQRRQRADHSSNQSRLFHAFFLLLSTTYAHHAYNTIQRPHTSSRNLH